MCVEMMTDKSQPLTCLLFHNCVTYLGEVCLFDDTGSNLLFDLLHLGLLTQGITTTSRKWIKSISVKY